jgi:photosystem II stability/assembly factor-like uncharacterized protein
MCKNFTRFILIAFAILVNSTVMFSQNFWELTNAPTPAWSLEVARNGNIWVIIENFEIYLSTDNGDTWVLKAGFPFIQQIAISPVNEYIFVTTLHNGLFRSTDNGESWEKIANNQIIFNILITTSGEIYFTTTARIYYSNDNGDTWIENSLPYGISTVSLVLGRDGTLYGGSFNFQGVYRSTDGGNTWLSSSNYTDVLIRGLAISDDGSIFATANSDGVLKSTDGGVTWTQVNTGLGVALANRIIYNPVTGDIFVSDLYSGASVYRSTNLGESWKLENTGILNIDGGWTYFLAVNPITGMMFIASENGVYRSTNHEIEKPTDNNTILFQSSPNPVRSGHDASIRYRINTAGQTSLIVYDILGKEVTKLVNEHKWAGVYSVNFNTKNLSSGVYFYKLRAADYEGVKKMLIIR